MDDLAFLRGRIESYADYTNDDNRRLTDEQVRAYVGEALSRMLERLSPQGALGEALTRVLLRCQFADQQVVRALTDVHGQSPAEIGALHSADRELIDLADRADAADPASAGELIGQVDTALDRRAKIVLAGDNAA